MSFKLLLPFLIVSLVFFSCEEEKKKKQTPPPPKPKVEAPKFKVLATPDFRADSAFLFLKKQVDFGPRVPGSDAQKVCAYYFKSTFERFGTEVLVQEGKVTTFNQLELPIFNIIARIAPEKQNRIMLFAHWDTRPFADRDQTKRGKAIDGANDGASGAAVLMELARAIQADSLQPKIGVDIILFDAEDYGEPHSVMGSSQQGDTWCLGSQYWANNPPIPNYKPKYGVLLDMVGGKGAVFPKEAVSMHYAPQVVNKVWYIAQQMGHGNYFTNDVIRGGITDDHLYVNKLANIPSIDIIHYHVGKQDFGSFHHTHADNIDVIDTNTLKVVGDVVMQLIYQES